MGAVVLVKLMATDGWGEIKARLVQVLGHGDVARTDRVRSRLEQTRIDLLTAVQADQEQIAGQLEAVWQGRLLDLLEEDPAIEGELRALVDTAQSLLSQRLSMGQQQVGSFGRAQQAIQGHGIQVNTFVGQDETGQYD
jgi:hypothetical protein